MDDGAKHTPDERDLEMEKLLEGVPPDWHEPDPRRFTFPTPPRREAPPEDITLKPSFTSIGDLLIEPEEQTNWIVEGLLPVGGISVLVSKPKVGKSTAARQLALCVARGEPFLGRTTTQGSVLYVALEERRSGVKEHFKLMSATGTEDIGIFIGAAPKAAQKWLEQETKQRQPSLIIIDTLFRWAQVSDVNNYSEVTTAFNPLLALAREHNAHLLLVHHARKGGGEGGDSTLGSTAIFGSVDTSIILKKTEGKRTIETQQRYGVDMEPSVLVFDSTTQTITLGGTKEEDDTRDICEAIVLFLEAKGEPIDEPSIDAEIEGRTTLKRKALRKLVTDGRIFRSGSGRRGNPFLYSCSLVPTIYTEQEKQEPQNPEKALPANTDARSTDTLI